MMPLHNLNLFPTFKDSKIIRFTHHSFRVSTQRRPRSITLDDSNS